jgi:hypothetical protein
VTFGGHPAVGICAAKWSTFDAARNICIRVVEPLFQPRDVCFYLLSNARWRFQLAVTLYRNHCGDLPASGKNGLESPEHHQI